MLFTQFFFVFSLIDIVNVCVCLCVLRLLWLVLFCPSLVNVTLFLIELSLLHFEFYFACAIFWQVLIIYFEAMGHTITILRVIAQNILNKEPFFLFCHVAFPVVLWGWTVSKVSKLLFLYIKIFCTEKHAYVVLKSYFFLLYTKESLLHFAFYHLLIYYVQYQNS